MGVARVQLARWVLPHPAGLFCLGRLAHRQAHNSKAKTETETQSQLLG